MSRVAAIQMASGPNVTANLTQTERLLAEAAENGAELIVLPENFAIMGNRETDKVSIREADGSGPIQDFLAQQAQRLNIWLVGGTIPLQASSPERVRASCLLFDNNGQRVARYDKVHLFDVTLADEGKETYVESETIEPGQGVVVVDTPFGRLGLAICYDLRFPEMFRCMLNQGMEILALPAAFTAITGKAHWETLTRARAIENLCYVIAPDQGGYHVNGKETHGNSLIIDPWGTVLNQRAKGPGVITADIERDRQATLRRNFPVIQHRRITCTTP